MVSSTKTRRAAIAARLLALAILLIAAAYIPTLWRHLRIVYWDRVRREGYYLTIGPQAIPYTIARLRSGGPDTEWYGSALCEHVEDPKRIGPAERRALSRAIEDLQHIARHGNPEAAAVAARTLTRLGHAPPDLPQP